MSDIDYPLLTKDDLPELRTLVKEAYSPRDPMTLCLHATPDEVMTYFMEVTENCIKNNGKIHVGARDHKSGKLIGCMVNNILSKERKQSPWAFSKCTTMMEYTYRDIMIETENCHVKTPDDENVFEFVLLTVDPNYSAKGIATKMVKMSEDIAIKEGFKLALLASTNIISQHIFTELGYKVDHTFDYATFELVGKKVLDPVPAGETKGWLIQSKSLI